MEITEKTTYEEFEKVEKYLTAESVAALKKAAEHQYGSMYSLEFGTFVELATGDLSSVLGDYSRPTVLQKYWSKRFEEFVKEFAAAIKRMTIDQDEDEKQAAAVLLPTEWSEGVLVFVQSYFGLKSFREAEKITMGEILIAKKAAYNEARFNRKLAEIRKNKFTTK